MGSRKHPNVDQKATELHSTLLPGSQWVQMRGGLGCALAGD